MQAKCYRILLRRKLMAGGLASPHDFLSWPLGRQELPDQLPLTMTPYSLQLSHSRPEHWRLILAETKESLVGQPFLYLAQYRQARRLLSVGADELQEWLRKQQVPTAPIFVCGIGRSGTTLLTRAFDQLPQVTVYDEPDVFTQLVAHPGDLAGKLAACVAAFHQPSTRLVLKQRSFVSFLITPIRQAFPDARILFLYRGAVPWVQSNLRMIGTVPLPRRAQCLLARSLLGDFVPNLREQRGLSLVELIAYAWVQFLEHYVKLRQQGTPVLAMHYDDLVGHPQAAMQAILSFCGLPASSLPQTLQAFSRDSQQGTFLAKTSLSQRTLTSGEQTQINALTAQSQLLSDPPEDHRSPPDRSNTDQPNSRVSSFVKSTSACEDPAWRLPGSWQPD